MTQTGPRDPRIAAFFDIDGTLIAEPSLESRFFRALRRCGAIPLENYVRWTVAAFRLLPQGLSAVQQGNKRYLHGLRSDLVYQHIEAIPFFDEAVARVTWHAQQGHEIVLVSGTLEPLARMVAVSLECELEARDLLARVHVCATRLEEQHGRWTGRLLGEAVFAENKCKAMTQFARQHQIELRSCHAYGNAPRDRFLLAAAGHAHVVNPGKELAALANLRDWPIWYWHQERNLPLGCISTHEAQIQQIESGV